MDRVRFWGTRGSLPVALTASAVREKVIAALRGAAGRSFASDADLVAYVDALPFTTSGTFGGHSPCVELVTGGPDYVLCDLGTGARPFGQSVLARHGAAPQTFHVFMSHVHWDHIMGFPFFAPAYRPGHRVRIYGAHEALEAALRRQQAPPSFPVEFASLGASIEFVRLEPDRDYDIAGLAVRLMLQRHAGDSYGYRFTRSGKTVIYSTDSEHALADLAETHRFVEFFRGADLVVFDAMYSLADSISVKADWGHSSNIVGVDLCHMAGARHLCLFHHEPVHGDEAILRVLGETQRYEALARRDGRAALRVSAAYDGMEVAL
ncbi:MAG TPA: MBL fold metallo-hydrolase [Burkholderiaceae bacterium]|nr:MBL fold metallo-hydrolase [Burkholderiaceae bacterium]